MHVRALLILVPCYHLYLVTAQKISQTCRTCRLVFLKRIESTGALVPTRRGTMNVATLPVGPEALGATAAASMCAGGAFESGGLVKAQGASSQSLSGGCSELEYEELLRAEAEVLASCGPEVINRMWARVIEKEFARSPVFKFDKKCDLTAMDLSVLVVEDQPFQQQAINALLQIYSMRNPSVTFRTKIVDSAVSAMSVLQRRRDFHMVRHRPRPLIIPEVLRFEARRGGLGCGGLTTHSETLVCTHLLPLTRGPPPLRCR